jgi:hypothetical protein
MKVNSGGGDAPVSKRDIVAMMADPDISVEEAHSAARAAGFVITGEWDRMSDLPIIVRLH